MMVLPRENVDPLGLEDTVAPLDGVVNYDLVGALANLSLAVELEAAAEGVHLVVVAARGVAAPPLYGIDLKVLKIAPVG